MGDWTSLQAKVILQISDHSAITMAGALASVRAALAASSRFCVHFLHFSLLETASFSLHQCHYDDSSRGILYYYTNL